MTYELTAAERTEIVHQHLKNIQYRKYNVELSLIEENALTTPNSSRIDELNADLALINTQEAALITELESLA
jgi:hypothetical protein